MAKRKSKKVNKKTDYSDSTLCCTSHYRKDTCSNAVYGLGFVGSAIYYISTATGFWMGVLGLLKAMVWPAFVVYELLKFLGM